MGEEGKSMWRKVGVNLKLKVGERKGWRLGVKGGLVYDMKGMGREGVGLDGKGGGWEMRGGVSYDLGWRKGGD